MLLMTDSFGSSYFFLFAADHHLNIKANNIGKK